MIAIPLGNGHTRYIRDPKESQHRNQYDEPATTDADVYYAINSFPLKSATLRELATALKLSESHTNNLVKPMVKNGLLICAKHNRKLVYSIKGEAE